MPIVLQSFAESGETAYIGKHNANVAALLAFLNSLETTLASVTGSSTGLANASNIGSATYGAGGTTMAKVGSDSFSYTTSAPTMTIQGGFCWDPTLGYMHYQTDETVLTFMGKAPGTYYIRFDGASTPYIDTISSGAIYSVVWDGSAFNTITDLMNLTPTAPDIGALAYSPYSGITYPTPQARVVAVENAISDLYEVSMAPGDFTPTTEQAMEHAGFRLTGAITVNRAITVPPLAKLYIIRNEVTTSNGSTVTIKTAATAGVALRAGENAVLWCDATGIFHILRQGASVPVATLLDLLDTPAAYTSAGLKLLRVREDLTGIEFVDPAGLVAPATLEVMEESTPVDSAVTKMDFVGSGVTVTQVSPGIVQVTIGGGAGSSLAVTDEGLAVDSAVLQINFEGDGVVVTQTAPGAISVTIPGPPPSGAVDYDVSFYIADKRPAGAVAFRHTFTKAVNFPANFSASDADAVAAATASAVWTIKKNGTTVGTLTFSAGATTGVFASTGGAAVSFVAGDILEVTAPNPQDATLLGVSVTMSGTRV